MSAGQPLTTTAPTGLDLIKMAATTTATTAPATWTNGTDTFCVDHGPDALAANVDQHPRRKSHRIDGVVWSATDAACDTAHRPTPRRKSSKTTTAAAPKVKPAPKATKPAPAPVAKPKPAPKATKATKVDPAPATKVKPAPKSTKATADADAEVFYVVGAGGEYVQSVTKDDVTLTGKAVNAKRFASVAKARAWALRMEILWLDDAPFQVRTVKNGRVQRSGGVAIPDED